jgi:hypothetical protein
MIKMTLAYRSCTSFGSAQEVRPGITDFSVSAVQMRMSSWVCWKSANRKESKRVDALCSSNNTKIEGPTCP